MMTVVMRQLTDDDIQDLAAFYASLEPKTKAER
jgi:cytochrome c553